MQCIFLYSLQEMTGKPSNVTAATNLFNNNNKDLFASSIFTMALRVIEKKL